MLGYLVLSEKISLRCMYLVLNYKTKTAMKKSGWSGRLGGGGKKWGRLFQRKEKSHAKILRREKA